MRKLIVAGAGLVLIAIALLVVAVLSLNRIIAHNRERIVQRAESALGRALSFDTMTVGLWGGIGVRLEQVRIADDPQFSSTDFLRAAAVTARADLWPLLRGELQVGRIDIAQPQIQLIRDASGRWNYSTLKALRADDVSATSDTRPTLLYVAAVEPTAAEPLPLLISRASIDDGTLVISDRSQTPVHTTRIEHIDLAVNDLSVTTPIRFRLDAAVQATSPNVHVRGHLGPLQNRAAIPLEIDGTLGPLGPREVRFDDVHLQASVTRDSVRAAGVQARAFGGSLSFNGQYPLQRDGEVILKGQLTDIDIAKVLEVTMADAARRIAGTGHLTLDLRATGNTGDAIEATLAGTVAADVKDGVVKDFSIANEVLARITGLPTISNLISAKVKPKYSRLFSETETRFQTLRGSFRVAEQRMQTDDLAVIATDYGVRAKGWIGFSRDVDLTGTLAMSAQFSRDVAADVKEAKYLIGDHGELTIPFRWRGKIGESKPEPDLISMAGALTRGISSGGAKDLLERLLGKSKRPTPSAAQPSHPLEQRLRDLLGR